ncbi:MAG: type II restriction endonuclease [Anaeroplasma bactoclasticum]|nr:type II restriction endonuclease [Anaeroplasma bactoclasticum]
MKRNFEQWISKFKESIADYKYYIDFDTVVKNKDSIKVELNIMNSLIGSPNIEEEFDSLLVNYPQILKCIPILLAKREMEIFCMDQEGAYKFVFDYMGCTKEEYKMFMRKTGLFDLMQKHLVNNLVDYVLGVETGLNSNARKNRGGHLMENLVERYIVQAGFIRDTTYFKEMYLSEIEDKFQLDLSAISNQGKTKKRFDFVLVRDNIIYAIECNFYSSGGSKLNETARSYKNIALESQNIENFKFVWFTDGKGWESAKNNLEETFEVLDTMYSIHDLENGILLDF